MRRTLYLLWGLSALGCTDMPTPAEPIADSPPSHSKTMHGPEIIPGKYIIQTMPGVDPDSVATAYGIVPEIVLGNKLMVRNRATGAMVHMPARRAAHAGSTTSGRVRGFSGHVPASVLDKLRQDPRVKRVEADRYGYPHGDGYTTLTSTGYWNLDRLDQPALPLDGAYRYQGNGGQYVTVYVLDSGIRLDHEQFQGRAYYGADFWHGARPPAGEEDCSGHGTAMASLIGGVSLGVARAVSLVSVRVISCPDPAAGALMGRTTYAHALAGLRWVLADKSTYLPNAGAVANLSWGFPLTADSAKADSMAMLEEAIADLVDAGVTVVASSGNDGGDSCLQTPSRMSPMFGALSVGALTKADERLSTSNHGFCVTVSAPGDTMRVAFPGNSVEYREPVGQTSGAAAHVSGVAALYLALHPSSSPEQVEDAIFHYAHQDVLQDPLTGSKLLVSTRFIDSVAVAADPTRLGSSLLGINEGVAVRCHGFHASGVELDQVRCRWRSSDTTIAVVSPIGVVTGRAPGTVWIHGESGPDKDSLALTVAQPFRAEPVPLRARMNAYLYNQMGGPGGTTTLVEWWTGDGTYGTGESLPHRYRTSGVYVVKMCIHGLAGFACYTQSVAVYP